MKVKFYAIVNNGKNKILLADWYVNVESFKRDILLYKSGMSVGVMLKYKHGQIICESESGNILDKCTF